MGRGARAASAEQRKQQIVQQLCGLAQASGCAAHHGGEDGIEVHAVLASGQRQARGQENARRVPQGRREAWQVHLLQVLRRAVRVHERRG
jgi:hypothetical protein